MLNKFIDWANNNNWNVLCNSEKTELPNIITDRYQLPKEWIDFVCNLKICENKTATKWFLTPNDYLPQAEGFQWNEFELQSLEFIDNEDEKTKIISFWNNYLPIILSVDGDYSYYAIKVETGNVVIGYEPEYEEITVVADSFNVFLQKIISGEIVL